MFLLFVIAVTLYSFLACCNYKSHATSGFSETLANSDILCRWSLTPIHLRAQKYLLLIGSVSPCLCAILGKIYIINMLIIQKSNIKINVNSEAAEQYIPVFLLPHSLLLFVTLVGSSSSFRLLIVQGTRTQRLDFFLSLWTNPFMISASLVALHAINRLSLPKFICPA